MEAETLADAAAALRRLLAAVESGQLEADSATARALVRRIEGAAVALEQAVAAERTTGGDRETS
jgi:hypothetical protein